MYCNMYYFDDFLLLSLKDNNKYKESLIDEYKDSENKIYTIDFCLDKENLNNLSFKHDIIFKEICFRFEKIYEIIEKHFKELDFEEYIEDYIIFLIDNKKEILEKINNINKRLKKYNCVIEIDKGNFNKNNRSYWVIARIYYKYKNYKFSINRLNLYSKHFYRDVNEVFFSKNLSEILNYIDNYYLNFENKVIKKKNFITYSKIIKKVVNSFCKKYKNNKYFEISFDKLNQEDKTKLKFYYSEYCNDKYYNGDECSLLEIDNNYNYCLVYTDLDNYKEIQINNDSCVDEVINNLEYYKNIVLNKYLKVLENKNIVRFLERK